MQIPCPSKWIDQEVIINMHTDWNVHAHLSNHQIDQPIKLYPECNLKLIRSMLTRHQHNINLKLSNQNKPQIFKTTFKFWTKTKLKMKWFKIWNNFQTKMQHLYHNKLNKAHHLQFSLAINKKSTWILIKFCQSTDQYVAVSTPTLKRQHKK